MDQKLKNYSSGMQVRLAFSMATRSEADILLIDEVLAVGDADFQRKCFVYFKKLKKNKKTVIFVSHDMDAVKEYCDRAIMIEKSRVVDSGDAEKIAQRYTKMFIEQAKEDEHGNAEDKRWGDGTITYEYVSVTPKKVTSATKEVVIEAQAIAHQTIDSPIFGIMIKNGTGNPIMGTNTKIKSLKIPQMKKGEKKIVRWSVPNIFSEGTYFIDPAIVYNDGITTSDWVEEAAQFSVLLEEKGPYIITPDIKVEFKND